MSEVCSPPPPSAKVHRGHAEPLLPPAPARLRGDTPPAALGSHLGCTQALPDRTGGKGWVSARWGRDYCVRAGAVGGLPASLTALCHPFPPWLRYSDLSALGGPSQDAKWA